MTRLSPLDRDQPPGMDLEFLRGFLDCLIRIGRLDAADKSWACAPRDRYMSQVIGFDGSGFFAIARQVPGAR
jgi:hypothetical protein